jgi:methionyl-tRNA formyltransferase
MKVLFLTQDDPIYILPFFDEFFRNYHDRFEIAGVFCSRAMGKRKRLQLLKELLSLYGPTGFVRLVGRVTLAKLLGKLPASKQSRSFRSLGQLCRTFDAPYLRVTNPNDAEVVSEVRRMGVDLIVSVACPYILKESILGLPSEGSVNIHHALLPHYKGMMPTFWQMFHGESSVGLTIHYMTPKVDEGVALLQESLEVQTDETLDHLICRSKRHGAHCMARVLKEIETGTAKPTVLDNSKGSYFTFPTTEEIREFHRKGLKAI